jgi:glutaredoxin 3
MLRKLTIYTTEPCAHCRTAKDILARRGVAYDEVNLSKDPDGRAELARRTGLMTFPQILIGDEPLGGARELHAAASSGRLDELLAA